MKRFVIYVYGIYACMIVLGMSFLIVFVLMNYSNPGKGDIHV